ncbi:MAG: dipicolinate synthase subunit DpsA [Oscillospiraceae bacterium]|nr:dipicolinate synthase subunit DpsA [Oscillospiraceae bacterium]
MNEKINFLIAGGDLRQVYTAKALSQEYNVYALGLSKNHINTDKINLIENIDDVPYEVDHIILPLPVSQDGEYINAPFSSRKIAASELIPHIKNGGIVFGGKFDDASQKIFTNSGIETIDYFDREELNVLNAVPTAEGAVQIAMEETASTIYGQNILITGFGRISKVLIKILNGMGANVTVTARKYSDLAWAEIYGCKSVHTSSLHECIDKFDIIFNTVPAVLFDEYMLNKLRKDTLMIDLASKPGGVDFDIAGKLGLKVIWALSLPGKVAPVSSGEIIAGTVLNILKERGKSDD